MLRPALAAVAVALVLPGSALANTVGKFGNQLLYSSDTTGESVEVLQDSAANPTKIIFTGSVTPGPGCSSYSEAVMFGRHGVSCPASGIASVALDLGDGDDSVAGREAVTISSVALFPVSRPMTVSGGAGDDSFVGGTAGDDFGGGTGTDTISYAASGAVRVSTDDVPNDGTGAGAEHDNVRADVENLTGSAAGDILIGGDADNVLVGGAGADNLTGNGGLDAFRGGADGDTVSARDGIAEQVDCGDGTTDGATVDSSDAVMGCETVDASATLEGDVDRDGSSVPADCNDKGAGIHPGAAEFPDDGIDQDCDGFDTTVRDADGDGSTAGADCNDADASVHPGATEVPGDAVDQDCDGHAPPFSVVSVFFETSFRPGASTKVRRLRFGLPAGTTARLACTGGSKHGCKVASSAVAAGGARGVDVRRALKLGRLRAGAVVQAKLTRPGAIGRVRSWTFRSRKAPAITRKCLLPGGAPTRCP